MDSKLSCAKCVVAERDAGHRLLARAVAGGRVRCMAGCGTDSAPRAEARSALARALAQSSLSQIDALPAAYERTRTGGYFASCGPFLHPIWESLRSLQSYRSHQSHHPPVLSIGFLNITIHTLKLLDRFSDINISHFWLGLYPLVTRNVVNTHRLPSGKMQMQINFQVHGLSYQFAMCKFPSTPPARCESA